MLVINNVCETAMVIKISVCLAIAIAALTGCQTLSASSPQSESVPEISKNYGNENVVTTALPTSDSDGDGVLDDVDECPQTPLHTIVDVKGCEIIIEGGEALEMAFNGFFPSMSSQLPNIYGADFEKMAQKLEEHPEASVFIFGHTASNEIDENSIATFGFDSLARNRALIIKNKMILEHNINAERLRTYDCSNKLLIKDTGYIDHNSKSLDLKNTESIQRRATLRASSLVHDLTDLKYASDRKRYDEYAKYCERFES